ncbi:NAD(P)H-binding protein [Nocardia sp. NPDC004860]|uniref:SDR family oxidoreductase n=1 Tax=Nocardia sp. NPDC004860 TaxID=3154557 RepID=UPI0033BE75F2
MIVVTGATGNVGRALVRELADAGEDVVALSRAISPVDLPPDVTYRVASLSDLDAMRRALAGAEALFLVIPGEQMFGGVDAHTLLETAKSVGIRRLVLLSSQAAQTRPTSISHHRHREFESAAPASGLDWTILRPGGFHSNSLAWAASIRETHTIAAPFADVGLRLIDPTDIAAVAAQTLTTPGHSARTYTLTGPEPITPRQQAKILGEVLDHPITFTELTREQAISAMPLPAEIATGVLDLLGAPTLEELEPTSTVDQILNRPFRTYAQWAHQHASAFR